MLERLKSKLPLPLRRSLHKVMLDPIEHLLSDHRVSRSVRSFRRGAQADREFVERLRRAWGNEAWSADASYVQEVFSRVGRCEGAVLECGSGLTTLAAALAGERVGVGIWSLEQDEEWADLVRHRLAKCKVRNVELHHAALEERDGYVWYDIKGVELPNHFDLVVCDGPAVRPVWGEAHALWRYGVLAVMRERGVSVGEVLLDDATEPRAAHLLQRWKDDFGMVSQLCRAADGDCAVAHPPADC